MARNLVQREDGKLVNVARKQGQLFVCATGCCCGHTERGFAPVPEDRYHAEWERRKLRNRVHLTQAGCLGPCPLANVALLLFDGRHVWFHSINTPERIAAIYDYAEAMLAANAYLPPPPALAPYHFTSFTWDAPESHDTVVPAIPARRPDVVRDGFLVLSQADTDLLAIEAARAFLPTDFPPVRAVNPSYLSTEADIAAFLDAELPAAELVVVRLLGGRGSFAAGLDRIVAQAQRDGFWLICLPGTESLDPELMALSNAGVPIAHELSAYLLHGGPRNYAQALCFLADHLLTTGFGYDAPAPQPRHGVYHPEVPEGTLAAWRAHQDPTRPTIGLLFYRAHLLSGNTAFVDAIVQRGAAAGLNLLPVFAYSLKETGADGVPEALSYLIDERGEPLVDAVLCSLSFAMGGVDPETAALSDWAVTALERLDVPVVQIVTASSPREQWLASLRGLNPVDAAMNVAIPEFDGRIISVPVSFKEADNEADAGKGAGAVRYVPDEERIDACLELVRRLAVLRRKPNAKKRIAFVLTNQAARASRIGNAVGLDAPASLIRLLEQMKAAGYTVEDVPESGDQLIHDLIARCSYDTELLTDDQLAGAAARVLAPAYADWFADLSAKSRAEMLGQWGEPPGAAYVHESAIALAGLRFGNVFVALQPPRGYGMDPNAIYHLPDLPPTHNYHALYRWLRDEDGFAADAIVHLGKHGTLEWLPGKAAGPGPDCYPDQFLAGLPLVYPFIINDPGEGTQAKRRAHAVVVDHMTPPLTSAGLYGELAELGQLIDEYYQVELLDPAKTPLLQRQIWDVLQRAHLGAEMELLLNRNSGGHTHEWDPALTEDGTPVSLTEMRGKDFAHLLQEIDGYLCELAGAQIRDGLHVLGQVPEGAQLTELLFHLTRLPNLDMPALPDAVAIAAGAVRHDVTAPANAWLAQLTGLALNVAGDVYAAIDALCRELLSALAEGGLQAAQVEAACRRVLVGAPGDSAAAERVLRYVCAELLPKLQRIPDELGRVLEALDGRYTPAGPSGAPTRGMAHVLPTGRNFYGVDPRAIPSVAAWQTGRALADELLAKHLRDEGRYPESVGISIWGTSAMRTHGDDIAEVFALLGVQPRWQPENRRLLGIDVIPLEALGRPRIDVVCRISGFFRDAFPHLIAAIDEAVRAVAALDEPPDQNFVRRHALAERGRLAATGLDEAEAERRSLYRIFGCKPGSYGAGILPLIDERNWRGVADFAEAYLNWGGYAYTGAEFGTDARSDFKAALERVVVAVKNQDNREHDIFDSDDYLQFHGGMIATIRALTGRAPRKYFGDSADPRRARVRDLKEEALRVFRSRVINPKWLESIRRHGYKGGLELAATVDYLFGYDATADVVDDWMYADLTDSYVLAAEQRDFLRQSNPWALRDIAGRLLEAVDRGLWQTPDADQLDALRAAYLESDGELEGALP
ncbi:MAG TPA: cobaltochelatase subunit CobN [Dehalococcoidia bacterium]|nr:cobaltochelatase subunit CobN [Dehalococcoidia bacterium]